MICTEAGERLLQHIQQWHKEMASIQSLNRPLQQLELRRKKLSLYAEEKRRAETLQKADLETLLDNAEKIGGEKQKLQWERTEAMSKLYVKILSDIGEIRTNFPYKQDDCPMEPVGEEAKVGEGLEKTTEDQDDFGIQEHNFYVCSSHSKSPSNSRPLLLNFLTCGKQKISEPIVTGNEGTVQNSAAGMSLEQ